MSLDKTDPLSPGSLSSVGCTVYLGYTLNEPGVKRLCDVYSQENNNYISWPNLSPDPLAYAFMRRPLKYNADGSGVKLALDHKLIAWF